MAESLWIGAISPISTAPGPLTSFTSFAHLRRSSAKRLIPNRLAPTSSMPVIFILGVEVDQEHRPTVEDLDGTFGLISTGDG